MANQTITNKQASILTLEPLQDVQGRPLTLRPKGVPGDACEITAEVAADEIVLRVKAMNWVTVHPVGMRAPAMGVAAITPVAPPVPEPPATITEPVPEPPAAVTEPVPEPAVVGAFTAPEPASEPAAVVAPEPAPEPPAPAPAADVSGKSAKARR